VKQQQHADALKVSRIEEQMFDVRSAARTPARARVPRFAA